jgi:DNA modification methylase
MKKRTLTHLENMCVEQRSIWRLKPCENNARTHSKKQIKQIASSIEQFGFLNPVLLGKDRNIVAGHGRVEAAKLLGITEVPTIRLDHLNDDEIRAYVIADNRLAELAGWDKEILAIEFQALLDLDLDFDITLTGFETAEIDLTIQGLNATAPLEEPLAQLDDSLPTITQPGDLYALGPHRIICGDVRESGVVKHLMKRKTAHMVFTDPPYNVPINGHVGGLGKHQHEDFAMACGEMSADEFSEFLEKTLSQLVKVCAKGSLHYICMDWRHIAELQTACKDIYTRLINLCVWVKTNGGMGSFYRSQHELVFVYQVGSGPHVNNVELGKHGRYRTNVWQYAGMNAFNNDRDELLSSHPTVKPIQLVEDAILDASNHGDIVLDGFLGAGTTLLAAERTQRVCYGVEIDPRYIDLTIRRWQATTGGEAKSVASQETFSDLEARHG